MGGGWGGGGRSHGEEGKKEQTKHEERAIKPGFSLDGAPLRLHRHRRPLKLRGDFRLKNSTDNSGRRMTENLIKVKKRKRAKIDEYQKRQIVSIMDYGK